MAHHLPHVFVLSLALPLIASAQTQPAATAGAVPIACFSASRAFAESKEGTAAQAKLAALRSERAREIDTRNLKLKDLQRSVEEGGASLDAATRRQREREMDRLETELQRMLQDAQAAVLDLQKRLEEEFAARLQPVIASVARERHLLLVLDQDAGGIVWSAPALDITADVVSRIDTH